ncbi:DUF2235 domain-containing protein [Dyella flagellata]|uniref:T6SS Phospholipase effector Tle1-like catalytic domain-containing protein n=1 Tax=Dyella flagellata TaxID=1867833 RepID=A0ABQ5XGQ9_9GAMM|nr:DUF2235 domain-containing protein [Dyella flagellata]GLQ90263.1 hypothetical protein GCM10007898_38380 [Dyella flagellata]
MADGKRIALFLDGTWNTVENNTNVWRAKSLCSISDEQICYYSQGVGTLFGQRFMGGAFGYGLDAEVIDAYEWLVEHYNPGDKLFIFGFSRGAYTARALSGLISKLGLLTAGSPLSVQQLYARYRKANGRSIRELCKLAPSEQKNLPIEERWLLTYSQPIAIGFVGVWDTVGALGLPFGNIPLISRSQYNFLQTNLWIDNETAYHALAIDEHRKAFAPTLWTWPHLRGDPNATGVYAFPGIDRVEQRWFVGAHANVGGGYADDLLAQRPLKWLMDKAKAKGLQFKSDISIDGGACEAPINDSFKEMAYGLYRTAHLFIPYYRKMGVEPATTDDMAHNVVNETIDASVFERWRSDGTYRPANLVDWSKRKKVDPGLLNSSVHANEPSVAAAV